MSTTPDRVRFVWLGRELVGAALGSDWDPSYNDQDECEDCGRGDVPLRAIKMVNSPRMMLCRDCLETAVEVGEVDSTDPRVDPGEQR